MNERSLIRVLMVDDNVEHIKLCQEFLPVDEFRLDAAYTGSQAMDRLGEGKYDIMILDYKLPDMNGLELLTKIKGLNLGIPIIFVSAIDDPDLSFKAIKEGACDYVIKTFQYYNKLRDRILENLDTSE